MTDVTALNLARRIGTGTAIALLAGAVVVLSIVLAVSVGAVAIPSGTVWGIALNRLVPGLVEADWSLGRENIVWEIRFPRVILAGLVGAGLGLVGAALQSVTRNPLADPHLLGISSGGAFGAIAALLHTGMFLGLLTVPLMAFGGRCWQHCWSSGSPDWPAQAAPTGWCWPELPSALSSWRGPTS